MNPLLHPPEKTEDFATCGQPYICEFPRLNRPPKTRSGNFGMRRIGSVMLWWRSTEISASAAVKGQDKRPAFDQLHKDATRRKFDLVMSWSVDRLGRSLKDLIHFLEHLKESHCDLFLHQQGLDTTTSAGRAMFQMIGVFAEFEKVSLPKE